MAGIFDSGIFDSGIFDEDGGVVPVVVTPQQGGGVSQAAKRFAQLLIAARDANARRRTETIYAQIVKVAETQEAEPEEQAAIIEAVAPYVKPPERGPDTTTSAIVAFGRSLPSLPDRKEIEWKRAQADAAVREKLLMVAAQQMARDEQEATDAEDAIAAYLEHRRRLMNKIMERLH